MSKRHFKSQVRRLGFVGVIGVLGIGFSVQACVTAPERAEQETEIDDVFYGDITEGLDAPLWDDDGFGYNSNDPLDRALSESPVQDREDWYVNERETKPASAKGERKTKKASRKKGQGAK